MNNMLSWSDYHIILSVAEAGSLSKAAVHIGSSHPTLFRKINAIEKTLGVRLFERFRTGYRLTASGEELVAVARQMGQLTAEAERRLAGRDLHPTGRVKVATTDSLLHGLLLSEVVRFRQQQPGITLDFMVSNEMSNLSYRDADIAIRPVSQPEEHLIGRKLGVIQQGIYGAKSLLQTRPEKSMLKDYPWVGPGSSMPYTQLHGWMKRQELEDCCGFTADTVLGLYAAVQAGLGLAVLPSYLAETDPNLARIGDYVADTSVDLWLLTHSDLRSTTRIRAVMDYFGSASEILKQLQIQ